MRTVLLDYDSGNLHSAFKAFERMARETNAGTVEITRDADRVASADRIVLPGDGAFPHCRAQLAASGMEDALNHAVSSRAVPFLGICVGMQMLASAGFEYERTDGLDWVPGEIHPIKAPGLKVPHMGWNDLVIDAPHPVLDGIKTGDHAYFVHSYAMQPTHAEHRLAHVEYGGNITAMVARDNIIGAQFHPEKSQSTGLRMIANFMNWRP